MPVNPSSNRSYAGQSGTFQSASAIAAHGLTKSYGQTLAVFDLSFEVAPGTALGLLGPNGAGKSTTMLMLAGVLKPDGGHVRIMGEVGPTRAKVRRHIGYAPQSLALYPELTAIENLQLLARLHGISRRTLQERVAQALELARLAERAHERVSMYSGGMQRRLNLAAATVHGPSVLLLDEPTQGVDPQSRGHIFSCIEALKKRGVSIVYSTHHLEEAERLCETIAILDNGRVLAAGSPSELVQRFGGASRVEALLPEAPRVDGMKRHWSNGKLSLLTDEPTQFVYQLLSEHANVQELSMRRPDLESVFMNLTGRKMRDTE